MQARVLAASVAVCTALADATPHVRRASRCTGRELRKVCMLNLSHCLLKLGRAAEAEAEASAVIALDKRSLKGYYRRCAPHAVLLCAFISSVLAHTRLLAHPRRSGSARLSAGALADAVADLSRAAALAPDDASVAAALADAHATAVAAGVDVSLAAGDASAAIAAAGEDEQDDDLPPLVGADAPPAVDPAALAKAREAMRSNPEMMKNMGDMMANMTEEQIEAMSSMAPPGMPVRVLAFAICFAPLWNSRALLRRRSPGLGRK